jgi:hypothetical protein
MSPVCISSSTAERYCVVFVVKGITPPDPGEGLPGHTGNHTADPAAGDGREKKEVVVVTWRLGMKMRTLG